MDRKSIIILLLSIVAMMGWSIMVNRIWPTKPAPARSGQTASNALAALTNQSPVPEPLAVATNRPPSETSPQPVEPESIVTLEQGDAQYVFTSRGGGIKLVELKDYPATVACGKNAGADARIPATVNTRAPAPILALSAANLARSDDTYALSRRNSSVRATREFGNGLVVEKEFVPLSNHLIRATVQLRNGSSQALSLPATEWVAGTATPMSADDEAHLGVFWYSGKKTKHVDPSWFANRTLGCFPGTPRSIYVAGESNAFWTAVHNQFFAVALASATPARQIVARPLPLPPYRPGQAVPFESNNYWRLATNDIPNPDKFIAQLVGLQDGFSQYLVTRLSPESRQWLGAYTPGAEGFGRVLDELNRLLESAPFYEENRTYFAQMELSGALRMLIEDRPTGADRVRLNRLLFQQAFARTLTANPTGYQASLSYGPVTLAPGETLTREFHIYAGPREYNTLARIGNGLKNHLDGIMDYDGFFGFFAKALLLSMNGLNSLGLSYALSIIVITIIIKTLFWPLTNASTKSMKRMAALQPEMKAIQAKYKDDPAKMNRKMMEFMKEHKVSPLGGCLPMLLQLPVFFGFFKMIRSAIELRGAEFLWVCDLSQPDTLFVIPGFNWPFNLLPLLMGATMLWQARLTPPSPGMDPAQQKIMRYMPLMFLAILYNFSAGLTLYWTVQNLLTIAQMKLTKARDGAAPGAPQPKASAAALPPVRRKKKNKR